MKKATIIFGISAGLLLGFYFSNSNHNKEVSQEQQRSFQTSFKKKPLNASSSQVVNETAVQNRKPTSKALPTTFANNVTKEELIKTKKALKRIFRKESKNDYKVSSKITFNKKPVQLIENVISVPRDSNAAKAYKVIEERGPSVLVLLPENALPETSEYQPVVLDENGNLGVVTGRLEARLADMGAVNAVAEAHQVGLQSVYEDIRIAYFLADRNSVEEIQRLTEAMKRDARIKSLKVEIVTHLRRAN